MNIFKIRINQREYAYLSVLLLVALSYIYKFNNFDLFNLLKNSVELSSVMPKLYIFFALCIFTMLANIYVSLIRINDTKISKWSLLSLLIPLPYIGIIYFLILLSLPSVNKTNNDKLPSHILIVSLFILTINIFLFGINPVTLGSIFLIIILLLITFILDLTITNLIKLCKKSFQKK